jgi:GT2 family glycosyltransferase
MNFPKVFIVILNWNGLQDTLQCLESVYKLDYPDFRVSVVDNGSTDDSVEVIKNKYPLAKVILNGDNLGYGGGNNVGIRHALANGAQYVWLLNNDTTIEADALLKMVVEAEKNPDIGIAGSKIYYFGSQKKIWFAGASIDWKNGCSNHIGMDETDTGQYDHVKHVDRITGCSMLVRKSVCESVGLFDEAYFLYVEEVDWCVRARKAGFKIVFVPSSVVYHKASVSVMKIGVWDKVFSYYNTRNFLYLIKNSFRFPAREALLVTLILRKLKNDKRNALKMLLSSVYPSYKLEISEAPEVFGVRDFINNKMGKADYQFYRSLIM